MPVANRSAASRSLQFPIQEPLKLPAVWLARFRSDIDGGLPTSTETAQLAEEYLRLGGRRKAAADDNKMSVRLWEDEPEEARTYWENKIAPLPAERRKEVESHLPSISGDSR